MIPSKKSFAAHKIGREPVKIDFLDEEDYFKISSNCFYVMYANDWKH